MTARSENIPGERPPIEVSRLRLEADEAEEVVEFCRSMLPVDEIARAERFAFPELRRRYMLARAALRMLLAPYVGASPERIMFQYGSHGKPTTGDGSVQFNLSHSGSICLFAVTRGCRIGIDVEVLRPVGDAEQIAARFFCDEEAADLRVVDPPRRVEAFLACWTRKEAYIKALGEGLSFPFDQFRVALKPGEPARFLRLHDDHSRGGAWTLCDLSSPPEYMAALAYNDTPRRVVFNPPMCPRDLIRRSGRLAV